jgi:hypothetical protein
MDWIRHTAISVSAGGPSLKKHSSGSIVADGTEQVVAETSSLMKLSGYIDLSNMGAGDRVVIRQYMRLSEGGAYRKYAEDNYAEAQDPPLVYITTKVLVSGSRVTIQQTAGSFKSFDYSFAKEE